MATKVIMPQMGESIFEGTITKWLKKVGESVARDEPLFEISTDKVDSEIPSPAAGVLSEILVPEGQTVQINTVVAVIDGEGNRTRKPEKKRQPAKKGKPVRQKKRKPRRRRKKKQARPPTGPWKTRNRRHRSRRSGLKRRLPRSRKRQPPPPKPTATAPPPKAAPPEPARDIRTSPLVRKLGAGTWHRSGPDPGDRARGRASPSRTSRASSTSRPKWKRLQNPDWLKCPKLHRRPVRLLPAEKEVPPAPAIPEAPKFAGESETVPMTSMRKAIAEHMVLSRRTSAHVSTVFEVNMTSIVQLREKHKESFEAREGIKLTYTPFLVKALVDTVREFPVLNCSLSGDNIIYKKEVHVGIAVALDTGLIVPVVKGAHLKSLTGLAVAIHDLAERARTKKLKPEEVQNGTITITNPGIYGGLFGTPIINQPQVAILGVGGIEKRPVVISDAIAIRSMVYLSLSFDHRVIDGAVADQAMASLKSKLESWTEI